VLLFSPSFKHILELNLRCDPVFLRVHLILDVPHELLLPLAIYGEFLQVQLVIQSLHRLVQLTVETLRGVSQRVVLLLLNNAYFKIVRGSFQGLI
jgi:hypothetical protein